MIEFNLRKSFLCQQRKTGKIQLSRSLMCTALVAQTVKRLSVHAGDLGSIPGLGRFPREGNSNPLQYS